MQIKIKEINGDEFLVQIESSDRVALLKSKIEAEKKILPIEMKLLFSGKVLHDDKTLDDYKVTENSKIMLTRVKIDLKSLVQKVLSKYYDSEKASAIASLVVTNMRNRAQDYSLDDIERLADSWKVVI